MRIVELRAENFKGLKAVDITPEGNVVQIAGRNGQGKTSVLDAIWAALENSECAKRTTQPIRTGEKSGHVALNVGDYLITRKFVSSGSTLTVTSADGKSVVKSPQKMLDELVGSLAFDPLAFVRQSDKEQMQTLLEILKIDLSEIEADIEGIYNDRRDVGRDLERVKAVAARYAGVSESPRVDTAELRKQYDQAITNNRLIDVAKEKWRGLSQRIERIEANIAELTTERDLLKAQVDELRCSLAGKKPTNIGAISKALSDADEQNKAADLYEQKKAADKESAALQGQYDSLANALTDARKRKAEMFASSPMPLQGLTIDEETKAIHFNGIPLRQISKSEQVKVAAAIAMSQHPELRVMRIEDASVLDDASLTSLQELAIENDYQVWIEIIDTTGQGKIVIEDGAVKQ